MAFVFSFLCTCTESFDRGLAPSSSNSSGAFDRCCCRRFQCQDTSACSTLRSPRFLLCYQIRRQTITKFMAAAQDGVSPCALRLWVSQCTSTSLGFSKNFTNVCRSDSTGSSPAKLLEVWSGPKLTYTRFTFDYVYNLVQFLRSTPFAKLSLNGCIHAIKVIILIMAAIISGCILAAACTITTRHFFSDDEFVPGIIIDAFADLKEEQKSIEDSLESC